MPFSQPKIKRDERIEQKQKEFKKTLLTMANAQGWQKVKQYCIYLRYECESVETYKITNPLRSATLNSSKDCPP